MKTELSLSHGKYALAAKYFPEVLSGAPLYKVQKYCKDIATPKVAVTQGKDIVAFAVQDTLNDLIVPQMRAYVKWGGKLCFLHVKWGGDGAGKEMFRDRRIPLEQPLCAMVFLFPDRRGAAVDFRRKGQAQGEIFP